MELGPSIIEKIDQMKQGTLTCEQNAQDFLANIKKNNDSLNIFLEIFDSAVEKAKELDILREKGAELGKLHGLIVAIKSNISYLGASISCASHTLEDYKGSYTSEIVEKLEQEGAIIIGIVNNDEFASGSTGESSAFGKTLNPRSPSRVPGGSSSGSAAAVAANMCDIALGSDTGGSIRNPASHCGVIGVKPSYGRVSRHGLVDLSMSLDQIGPFANDIEGCALVMEVISGKSELDATTKDVKVDSYASIESRPLKIGIINSFEDFITSEEISSNYALLLETLKKEGHEIVPLDIDGVHLGVQAYYPIVYTEFFSGTRKFDGVKYGKVIESSAGIEVLRRIYGGSIISKSEYDGAYYKKALKVKEIISDEFEKAFQSVDIIVAPTTPTLPHKFSDAITPEEMYAEDAFTIPANLAGICGGVVPFTTIKKDAEDISIGFQVFAKRFDEKTMFSGMKVISNLSLQKG